MYISNLCVDADLEGVTGTMNSPLSDTKYDIPYIDRSNKMLLKVLEQYALNSLLFAIRDGDVYVYNIGISRLHDDKLHTVGAHEIMALAELIVGEFIQGYSFEFDYEKFTIRRI